MPVFRGKTMEHIRVFEGERMLTQKSNIDEYKVPNRRCFSRNDSASYKYKIFFFFFGGGEAGEFSHFSPPLAAGLIKWEWKKLDSYAIQENFEDNTFCSYYCKGRRNGKSKRQQRIWFSQLFITGAIIRHCYLCAVFIEILKFY